LQELVVVKIIEIVGYDIEQSRVAVKVSVVLLEKIRVAIA